jgi:hypothetical protein
MDSAVMLRIEQHISFPMDFIVGNSGPAERYVQKFVWWEFQHAVEVV